MMQGEFKLKGLYKGMQTTKTTSTLNHSRNPGNSGLGCMEGPGKGLGFRGWGSGFKVRDSHAA